MNENVTLLIRRLLEKTAKGEICWEEHSPSGSFVVHFPRSSVTISEQIDGGKKLEIFNGAGALVEEVESAQPGDLLELDEIHRLARRQALNADETIQQLLNELV